MEDAWRYSKKEQLTVLAAACIAIFVNPMTGSMLNLALKQIQNDFGCSEYSLTWITSIFFIVCVMFLLPCSKLADIYGKKRTFLIGVVIGLIGAIASSCAWDIYSLYVFRGVTAVGMAFVSCTSVSMISDVYPPNKRGGAIGVNVACVYLGAALGPTIGGVITQYFGWRAVFFVLIPFFVIAFILMLTFRDNIISTPDEPMDAKGSVFYGIGIFVFMFGLMTIPQIAGFIMIAAGLAIIIGFIFYETKIKHPIFHIELFQNPSFTMSMIALFLNYASSFCIAFFMSRYLQEIGLLSETEAGVILMIQPAVQVVFTLISGRLSDKMDKRVLPTLGMIILCIGLVVLWSVTDVEIDYPMIYVASAILGAGFGIFSAPNTNAVMSYVKKEQYNDASGMISIFREIGMVVSMAMAACMISIFMGTETIITPDTYGAFIDVLKTAWIVCIIFNIVGCIFSMFRGKNTIE